jgi:isoleucyl-tRNA synthetase
VTESLDQFLITEPARALRDFILDFSQWYLRRSRERFKSDSVIERQAAAATTYIVLKQLAQLLAPLTPFLAEFVYQKLRQEVDPISVHLTTWPAANKIDEKLIVEMQATRELVTLALEARNKAGIKVRQPLAKLTITTEISAELQEIIKDEVNIKQVLVDASLAGGVILDTAITPELREEGEMRELIRQIQDWRKEAGLQPNQQVVVKITVPEAGKNILTKYQADIAQATSVTIQAIQVGESFAAELAA